MTTQDYDGGAVLDRIRAAMAIGAWTMADLAKTTGIPYRSLQEYLAGRIKLSLEATAKLSLALKVSLDWLILGRPAAFDIAILREALDATESEGAKSLAKRADSLASHYHFLYRDEYDLEVTSAPPDVPLKGRPRSSRKRSL